MVSLGEGVVIVGSLHENLGHRHCTPVTVILCCSLRGLIPDVSHNTEHWLVHDLMWLFVLQRSWEPNETSQVF